MELVCPYCKGDFTKGSIGNFKNGKFKWYDENLKFYENFTVLGGEILKSDMTGKSKCYRCKNCNKIIIDLNDF